jgi:hypothetical protein
LIAVSTALFVNPISTICATIGCTGTSSFISFLLFVFSLTTLFTEHSLFGVCTSLLHLVQYLGVVLSVTTDPLVLVEGGNDTFRSSESR